MLLVKPTIFRSTTGKPQWQFEESSGSFLTSRHLTAGLRRSIVLAGGISVPGFEPDLREPTQTESRAATRFR